MASDPQLVVAMEARLDKFEKQMAQAGLIADKSAKDIEDRFAKANPHINFDLLVPSAAIAAGVAIVYSLVDALASLGDRSKDLHLPVEDLQALAGAAKQARVGGDELNSGLKKFSEVSKKTAEDADEFYKALGNIGSKFVEAFKSAPTQAERLRVLQDAMASTRDEVKRAQLGLSAFGTDSERFTDFIASGRDALDDYVRKAKEFGIAIDEAMVKKAQDAQATISLLSSALGNQLLVAVGELLPALKEFVPVLERLGAAARDVIAGFASPESRPTATLRSEVNDMEAIISDFVQKRGDLIKKKETAGGGVVSWLTGSTPADIDKDIADLDKKIAEYSKSLEKYRGILFSRDDASNPPAAPAGAAFKPRPSLKDDSKDDRDGFDRAIERAEKRTNVLKAEADAVNLTSAARDRAKLVADLQTVAIQANTKAGLENTAVTADQQAKINAIADAYEAAAKRIEESRLPLQTFARESQKVAENLNRFGADTLDGFTNALADIVTGSKSAADAFKALANSIISDLARILIRQQITGPLAGFLGSTLSGLFGTSGGTPVGPGGRVGHNAGGTNYWGGGETWVGENGPEKLTLPRGSQITPASLSRSSGVQNNIQIVTPPGAAVERSSTKNGSGGEDLKLVISTIVAESLTKQGNPANRAARQTFGVRQQLTGR